jgi:hypothetical protein
MNERNKIKIKRIGGVTRLTGLLLTCFRDIKVFFKQVRHQTKEANEAAQEGDQNVKVGLV